jgi:hypothetical protein
MDEWCGESRVSEVLHTSDMHGLGVLRLERELRRGSGLHLKAAAPLIGR